MMFTFHHIASLALHHKTYNTMNVWKSDETQISRDFIKIYIISTQKWQMTYRLCKHDIFTKQCDYDIASLC